MFEEEAEEYQIRKHHQRLYGNKPVVMKELNTTYKDGFKDGYNKAGKELAEAKEIIKKFAKFVNNEAELNPEYPEYSQELTDLWNELCEQAEQFLKEVRE